MTFFKNQIYSFSSLTIKTVIQIRADKIEPRAGVSPIGSNVSGKSLEVI